MIKRFHNAKITVNGVIVLIVKRTKFDGGKGFEKSPQNIQKISLVSKVHFYQKGAKNHSCTKFAEYCPV